MGEGLKECAPVGTLGERLKECASVGALREGLKARVGGTSGVDLTGCALWEPPGEELRGCALVGLRHCRHEAHRNGENSNNSNKRDSNHSTGSVQFPSDHHLSFPPYHFPSTQRNSDRGKS